MQRGKHLHWRNLRFHDLLILSFFVETATLLLLRWFYVWSMPTSQFRSTSLGIDHGLFRLSNITRFFLQMAFFLLKFGCSLKWCVASFCKLTRPFMLTSDAETLTAFTEIFANQKLAFFWQTTPRNGIFIR